MPVPDDSLIPEHPGLIPSFLDWVGRMPQVPYNLIRGRPGAAGRQALDLVGDVIDAPLPGDWIPHISKPEDFTSPHELLGLDAEQHPLLAKGADLVGDTLLNPTTYLGGAAIKGLGVAAKGLAKQLPAAGQDALAGAGRTTRRIFAAEDVSPADQEARQAAHAAGGAVHKAQSSFITELFQGASPQDRLALGQVMHGIEVGADGKPVGAIAGETAQARAEQFLAQPRDGVNPAWLKDAVGKVQQFNKVQWQEGQGTGLGGNQFYAKQGADGAPSQGTSDYFPRQFSGIGKGAAEGDPGTANPLKARAEGLQSPEDVVRFLQEDPKRGLEFDASKVLGQRADDARKSAQQGAAGKYITKNENFAQAKPEDQKAANDVLKGLQETDPERGQYLQDLYKGLPPREGIPKFLAGANKYFKKTAVYGAIIPKIGTLTSNLMSGAEQLYSNPDTRGAALGAAKDIIPNLTGSISEGIQSVTGRDGFVGKLLQSVDQATSKMFGSKVATSDLQEVEDAFKQSGGSVESALKYIKNPTLRSAVENGVFDNGFVTSEQLVDESNRTGFKKFAGSFMDMPGVMFQGTEQRMRYALYKSLVEDAKMEEATAARHTSDALYDYNPSNSANRLARDIVPFWQFTAKAIPQQAKLLAEKPWLMPVLANLNNSSVGQPLPPWMEGKTNIPLGDNPDGTKSYASGFRMPYESLSWLPNPSDTPLEFGRQIEQNVIGSSQPLLKSAYSHVSGHDPYFESTPGSYDKIPGIKETSLQDNIPHWLGSGYNELAGTGMIQPVQSALQQAGTLLNQQHSLPVKALDFLTGTNVVDVNPQQALKQQLQAKMSRDPEVQKYETYYQNSKDPETQKDIALLARVKADLKAKRHSTELDPNDLKDAIQQTSRLGHVPGPLSPDIPVDDTQHIPLAGGGSQDARMIYLDSAIPDSLQVDGHTINPKPLIELHEKTEIPLLNAGLSYQPAHAIATLTEENAARAAGVDPVKYQEALKKHIKKAKKVRHDAPADLDPRPYLDSGVPNLIPGVTGQ